MWPLILIAAASAVAQKYQADKANHANSDALEKMKKEFEALVPPNYAGSVEDLPSSIIKKIPQPSFDMSDMTPEQYKLVGRYKPEVAPLVAEQRPDLVQDSAAGQAGKQAQIDAMRRLGGISQEDSDPYLAEQLSKASRAAQSNAYSHRKGVEEAFQRRGALNNGLSMSAQLSGGAQDMDRQAMEGQSAAAESYRNKLAALRGSADLGGQIRGADLDLSAKNTGIINDFNQRTSAARQQWETQRAQMANSAQMQNLNMEQAMADKNVGLNNDTRRANQTRQDALRKYGYQNQLNERQYGDEQVDRYNRTKDNKYRNDYNKVSGVHGFTQQEMAANTQRAQDNNNRIQGGTNAAMGAYGSYRSGQDQHDASNQAANNAYYQKNGRWMDDEDWDKYNKSRNY